MEIIDYLLEDYTDSKSKIESCLHQKSCFMTDLRQGNRDGEKLPKHENGQPDSVGLVLRKVFHDC